MNTVTINLPPFCNIYIWKNKNENKLKIWNNINKKYFNLVIYKKNKLNISIDKWIGAIIIDRNKFIKNKLLIENSFKKFLKSINLYFIKKIKFKGKGFRIKFLKKNKIIKFYFGRSHITFVMIKKIIKKRINKYKFVLKSINTEKLNKISKTITNIKKFNFYTLRGIRLSKQIIFKRKGKKGTYI